MSFSTDAIFNPLCDIMRAAGDILWTHHSRPRTVSYKGRIDLLTETDLAIEHFLKAELGKCLPEADFLAEESAETLIPSDYCWIIDPVDGTTNFAHGLPLAAISVALWHQGRVEMGVVNIPLLGEMYCAVRGYGAFCNNVPITVSTTSTLGAALVATGFPYAIEEELPAVLARMKAVLPQVQGVRRCGVASIDLAWLACGRFDAFYENRLKPWDVAAGWLLVEEAGGRLTHFDASPHNISDGEVLATNGYLHSAMSELLV